MRRLVPVVFAINCGHGAARLTQASTNVYARTDTDKTTIVSPTVKVGGEVGPAAIETTYTVDAWTGASVDVVTAATGAISERRHEVDAQVGTKQGVVTASVNYRFSTENDYTSHGVTLSTRAELASKNTTLGLDVLGTSDQV